MIDIQTAIRSSAVIYSDEIGTVKTTTIKRKYIEAIFLMNNNAMLIFEDLLLEIQNKFLLHFEKDEIIKIVNNSNDYFEYNESTTQINLTQKRFQALQNKEPSKINEVIPRFIDEHPEYKELDVLSIIYQFLYELLNSNIKTYSYIVNPQRQVDKPKNMNTANFSDKEIEMINSFITWKNDIKDKEIYKLVSFSIEYALVTNNSDGKVYTEALKTKIFYLDSNIIYRAIGTDGNYRKQRVLYFLEKCKANGQSFYISKYTKEEFLESIDFHIQELSEIPFGSINPDLFRIANCDSDFYEYYHKWRQGKTTKSLHLFKAFILSEYDSLIKRYNIKEDFDIPFRENDLRIKKELKIYRNEINSIKKDRGSISAVDAKNVYLIEQKRGAKNIGLNDTKYYLLSSDQKLKEWDNNHSKNQPILMIPSQWMGLLLKYVSRTNDDFASFLSFLKFQKHDSVLTPEELEDVVAGISEMTENFQTQEKIMQYLVADKFKIILSGGKTELRKNAIQYTKSFIEDKYIGELEKKDKINEKEMILLRQKYDEDLKNNKIVAIKSKINDLARVQQLLLEKKESIDNSIKKVRRWRLCIFIPIFILFYIVLFILTFFVYDWERMEPVVFFIGVPYTIISYLSLLIYGKAWNPTTYFKEEFIKEDLYEKNKIDNSEIEDVKLELSDLSKQLEDLGEKKDSLTE